MLGLALAYGGLLGLAFILGGRMSSRVREISGPRPGVLCWVLVIGVPAGIAGFISVPLLVMGLFFGGAGRTLHGQVQQRLPAQSRAKA